MSVQQKKYFRTPEAAEYLGLATSTLEKMRLSGRGCPYSKIGRAVIYKIDDLDSWAEASRQHSTSDTAPLKAA